MNRPCYVTFLLGLLLLAASSTAQQAPQIDIDYASFAYDEQESLVELYMAVKASTLTYEAGDSLYISAIPLELSLLSPSDTALDVSSERVVWEQQLDLQFAVMDTTVITEGQVFLRQVRLTVVPGEYKLQVFMPLSGQDPVLASRDVIIADYGQQESCALSDITLASRITPSEDWEDPFYKNGLRIRPNASQLYGEGAANLFYYAEAYNTACAASDTGEYTMLVYVSEEGASGPEPITGLEKRTKRAIHSTDVLVGRFDLSSLVSGVYFLHMEILDKANESRFAQTRKFFVSNPVMDLTRVESRIFYVNNHTTMREDEAERALIRIRHIEDVTAFISLDEQPELIGSIATLQRKAIYPESARIAGIQGRVIVQFTVDKEGFPRDFMVLRGIGGGCEEEVIRVITEHARFRPGISQGRAVPVRMSLPIIFRLPGRRCTIILLRQ
ncbi:MAG: energy transducer TonB [Rhodothermaceae bacterium]|nr:energy transducer TonB [Rhodothermaceae bacterium]MYI85021.1 energy transducer TonB [Rhodothermaceae bacterium]